MRTHKLLSLFLCAYTAGQSLLGLAAAHELTIANFDSDSPPCIVKLPLNQYQCTAEGCAIPLPKKGAMLESIQFRFGCLPKSAPTGFERPVETMTVRSIHAKNVPGHLSLIDEIQAPTSVQIQELNFCLYGKSSNFCGSAKVMRSKDGPKADVSKAIEAFVQAIELENT